MSKEEVIIRAVCGSRRSFTTFSVVLIRTDSGRQFRLDINGIKGDKLYDDEWNAIDDIIAESDKSGYEGRAILHHKYDTPDTGCWEIGSEAELPKGTLTEAGSEGSVFRIPIPN